MPGGTTPRASGSKTAPEANSSMQNSPEMAAAAASPPPPGGGGTTAATSSHNKHQSHADQTPPAAPNTTGNANSPAKSGKSPKKVPIPEEVERRGPEAMRVHEIMQEFAQDWEKTQLKKREQAVKKTVPDTAIGQTALLATQATATAMQVFAPGSGSPAKRESLAQQTAKGKKGSGAGAGAEKEKEPAYLKASLHKQQMQNTAAYKIFSKMYLMLFFWFIVATCWLIYSGQQYFNDTLPALRDIYFLHGGAARIEAAFDGFVQSRLLGTIEGIAHGAVMGMFEDPYDFFSLQLVVLAAMSSVPEASMLQMAYSYEGSPSSSSENQGGGVGSKTSSTVVAEPGQAQAAARTARRRKRQLRRKLDGHDGDDGDDGDDESPGVEIDRVNSPLMSGGFRFRRIGEFEMMHFESDLYPSCIAEPLACNRNLSIIQAPWYGHLQKVDLSAEMLRKRNVFRFDEDILVSSSASASAAQQMMTAPGLMDGGIRSEAEAKALEASGGVYYDGHTGRMRMPFEVYSGISTGDDAPLPSPYYCPAGMILATELEAYKRAHGIGVSGTAGSATASAAGGAANPAGTSAGTPATSSAVRNDPNATIPFPPELCSYRESYLALRAQVEKLQCDCTTCAAAVATNATTAAPAAAESGSPEAVCAALSAGAGAAGIFAGAAGGSAGSDAASNDTDSSSDATTATETTTGFACVALPTAETETTTPPPPFLSDQYDRGIYTEWEANLPERFSPGDTQVAMDSTHVMTVQTISLLFKIPIPESEHNTLQATLGGDPLAGSVDDLLLLSAEGSSASLRNRLRGLEDAVDRRRARGIVKRMLQHEGKSRRQRSGSAAPSAGIGNVEEDEYYALSAPPTTILEVRRDGSGDTHEASKGTRSTTATSATSSKKRTLQEAKSGLEHQERALGTRQSRLAQRARLRVARKLLEKRKRRRRTRSAAGADRNDATGGPHLGGILNPSASASAPSPAPPTSSFTAAELQEQLRRALSTTSSSSGQQDSEALLGLLQMVMQGQTPGAGTQAPPANKPLFLLGKITLEVDSLREQIVSDPHFLPEAYQGYIIAEDGSILVDLALKNTGVIEFMKIWEVDKFAGSLTPEMLAAAANDFNARDHFFLDDIIVKRLRGKRLQNRFFVVFWADSGGLADTMVALAAIAGIVLGALPYTVVACLVAYLMYQEKVRTRTQKLQAQAVQEAHTTLTAVNAVTQGKTSAPASAGGSQGSNSMANTRT
mmetsp:Transcript_27755/g.70060  ORF Transcript_27755/g.70060 Transcript_27755/m.70060 type:complete len:1230 (-) Transcript_27755:331-4020(-)